MAIQAAHLVRQALADAGLEGAVKTSGAKGVHVFVPIEAQTIDDVAAATRAIGRTRVDLERYQFEQGQRDITPYQAAP